MTTKQTLLDACTAFASDVSRGAVEQTIKALEGGAVGRAGLHLNGLALQRFNDMAQAWKRCDGVPLKTVADMLSGAAHAMTSERSRQRVELVWSGPMPQFSTLRSTGPAILELIESARTSIYLVTFAAYRVPEIANALEAAVLRGVRVVFCLESDEASGGKVNFNPLPHLVHGCREKVEVYTWPSEMRTRDGRGNVGALHAKFAVADRKNILVSSANFTGSALNLNIELGVFIRGHQVAADAVTQLDDLIRLGVLQRAVS